MLMALLMPLGTWAQGNIGVQLSTTMTKEFGTPDPVYLAATDFVIISNTTAIEGIDEEDLQNVLKFKRKQDNDGEDRGTYDYEVTVDAESEFMQQNPGVTIVATNTGRITITEKALEDEMIGVITGDPFTFKAAAWEPKPTVLNGETALVENTDFTYSWEDNVNAGTGKVKITAKAGGNYSGTAEKTFTINKRAIAADDLLITLDQNVFTYQGVEIEPVVTVKDQTLGDLGTLVLGSDYLVNYYNNINATPNATTARLKVKMPAEGGNYSFDQTNKYFTINKAPLTISIPAGQKKVYGEVDPALEVEYDGFVNNETAAGLAALETPQFVVPVVTRVAGENAGVYAISITNAAAVVAGATNYEVTIAEGTVNFSIQAKDIADVTITLSDKEGDNYIYNGEEHFKNVSVAFGDNPALTENVDYTVATTNNINAGENTAIVTVTGINNYKGTKTANFTIAQAEVAIIPNVASKAYGVTPDPALTYTLKVGETTVDNNVLNGTVELQREEGETVGAYKIWFKKYTAGTTADNYTIVNTDVKATEVENERYALFTITGSEQTLYLRFKEGTTATKVYGAENPEWTIADLEVDTSVEGGAECDNWEDIMYSFGDPEFAIASENVEDNETNEVTLTNQLTSPIYPTVVVASMPFTITKKDVALVVADQVIAYGTALDQDAWAVADGYAIVGEDNLGVVLATVNALGTYAPGTVAENAIQATISNTNYNLVVDECTWGKLTVAEAEGVVDLALDDSKDDNLIKINAHNGLDANVTIKFSQRDAVDFYGYGKWKAGYWTTLVLPFDISVADLSKAFGYAIVNVIDPSKTVVSGTSSEFYGKLTMKGGNGKDDVLAANKPILIKIADDIKDLYVGEGDDKEYYVVDFGQQTIVAPTDLTVEAGEDALFVGTYEAMTIGKGTDYNDGSIWFMLGDYSKWAFINAGSTAASWTIVPFAAYIDMSALPEEARENMTFTFQESDGSTTAIKGVSTDNLGSKLSAEGWYTLDGMKLQGAPTQKGIYIKDGKKVVIK